MVENALLSCENLWILLGSFLPLFSLPRLGVDLEGSWWSSQENTLCAHEASSWKWQPLHTRTYVCSDRAGREGLLTKDCWLSYKAPLGWFWLQLWPSRETRNKPKSLSHSDSLFAWPRSTLLITNAEFFTQRPATIHHLFSMDEWPLPVLADLHACFCICRSVFPRRVCVISPQSQPLASLVWGVRHWEQSFLTASHKLWPTPTLLALLVCYALR